MKIRLSKANRTVLLLLIYLIGISVYAFPNYRQSGDWGEYIAIIGGSLALFGLLWVVLNRREKFRQRERDKHNSEHL